MKSITIHNIDDELEAIIREKSKKEGKSLNKIIQDLLRKALGIKNTGKANLIYIYWMQQ